jgi:hypothetical protein
LPSIFYNHTSIRSLSEPFKRLQWMLNYYSSGLDASSWRD